jgi:hypothetical protein
MQVMPFWTRVLGDGDAGKLFHMQTNLRFGCVILRHYLDRERGDLVHGIGPLQRLARQIAQYPDAVLGAKRSWEFTAKSNVHLALLEPCFGQVGNADLIPFGQLGIAKSGHQCPAHFSRCHLAQAFQ